MPYKLIKKNDMGCCWKWRGGPLKKILGATGIYQNGPRKKDNGLSFLSMSLYVIDYVFSLYGLFGISTLMSKIPQS